MQQVRKNSLLAAAALAMMAAGPAVAADPGYPIPSKWARSSGRSGSSQTRAHDAADRERRRQKMAKKSRRDQRRRAKGKA